MSRVEPDETAFARRDPPFLFSIDGNWADPAADGDAVALVRDLCDDLQSVGDGEAAYLEMLGEVEQSEELVETTHRGNLHRLAEVKATYDPDNVFRLNRNISPALAARQPASIGASGM